MGREAPKRRRTDPDHSASATVSTPSGPGALACFSAQPRSERPGVSPFTEAVPTYTRPDVILLVEDDDTLRQLALNSLEREEYWVLCARDGEEAWNLFSEHAPLIRLVMTEVVLPGMGGLELAARLRHLSPDLRILYRASEDQLSDAVRQGVENTRNSYLMKPFDHEYLLLKVRAALKS